jgi:hypothetical protein
LLCELWVWHDVFCPWAFQSKNIFGFFAQKKKSKTLSISCLIHTKSRNFEFAVYGTQ